MKKISVAWVCLGLCALPVEAAQIPVQFHGLWYPNTAYGRAQCASYKKSPEIESAIATSLYVTKHKMYDFADYGEGDVAIPFKARYAGQGVWYFRSAIVRDGGKTTVKDDRFLRLGANRRLLYKSSRYFFKSVQEQKNFPSLLKTEHSWFFKCVNKINWAEQ